jgi:zinc protease
MLQFRSGAVDDPLGKAGVTYLAARLMAEGGTQALDSQALRAALFPMATTVHTRVDKELTTFYATFHRDHVAKMVRILSDVVAHPRFDPSEFARLRDAAINDVEKRLRQGDDENLGKSALEEMMFRGHAYGRLTLGHVGDLGKLTLDDVKKQAANVFTRDRLVIGLAGGYPASALGELRAAVATLPPTAVAPPRLPPIAVKKTRVQIVEKETDSTAISIGLRWNLTRHDPDYPALLVARSIFGEHRQMHGRLMLRLREQRGLNYGDYAYIEHFEQEHGDAATAQLGRARRAGEFTIWLRPVQNENALFALRAALFELQQSLGPEPFSDDEVERAKGFLDGYVLMWAETAERRLGYALDDRAFGDDKQLLAGLRGELAKITTADVNRVWRKWLAGAPEALEIVLVAPKAAALKQAIVANAPSPMHYQKDAEGHVPKKPDSLLARDKQIEKLPLGAVDGTVEIIPSAKLFE